jgi:DNA-binding response OmpR family regulator
MTQMKPSSEVLKRCGVVLDPGKQQATVNGTTYHLTPKECRLLSVFMQHRGEILTRAFLMREVWETDFVDDTRTIEVHVSWLRSKLESDAGNPQLIQTVRRVGYIFGRNGT